MVALTSCEKGDTIEQDLDSINNIENLSTNDFDKAPLKNCEIDLIDYPSLRVIDAQGAFLLVSGMRETITWSIDGFAVPSTSLTRSVIFPYVSYLTE
ncbi:hypothetical protein [Aquimarina sp. RZ0]|uniref:hypothetical protein n=1 Tax=Aquimarina sp. RZ0 TaxID=2607730 RepID=UPI0011F2199C|nr:hypothetical protein [Aquimarina sp. RZ0]KAA1246098.1 hypothetical protein F0000_08935 [Aquimarina sp. RZ0]